MSLCRSAPGSGKQLAQASARRAPRSFGSRAWRQSASCRPHAAQTASLPRHRLCEHGPPASPLCSLLLSSRCYRLRKPGFQRSSSGRGARRAELLERSRETMGGSGARQTLRGRNLLNGSIFTCECLRHRRSSGSMLINGPELRSSDALLCGPDRRFILPNSYLVPRIHLRRNW